MNEKTDIAIIGGDDAVLLFNAAGIKTEVVNGTHAAERAIARMAQEKCRIIFLTEEIYEAIPETIEKYQYSPFPIIIPLPTKTESRGIGLKKIKENVEKAIGIDIF